VCGHSCFIVFFFFFYTTFSYTFFSCHLAISLVDILERWDMRRMLTSQPIMLHYQYPWIYYNSRDKGKHPHIEKYWSTLITSVWEKLTFYAMRPTPPSYPNMAKLTMELTRRLPTMHVNIFP
jgi:hypothetical protein